MMRKTVAVCPPEERERRARLFGALEEALPVRFQGRKPGELRGGLDAVILFEELDRTLPTDRRSFVSRRPSHSGLPGSVDLGTSQLLDARLRGRSLVDGRAGGLEGLRADGAAVLASCGREALWTRAGAIEHVALAPEELRSEESLRDALAPDRWLSLLPLIHFLRQVAGDLVGQDGPTRASFIIDDPNLHWPSYGHVRFPELARDAAENGYHVAFSTIPLDAWLVHPGVARLFRENRHVLSLLVHGNDHIREELNRPRSDRAALALLAQTLQRVATLERRAGVSVSRVMVAPHGLCAEQMMRAMLLTGFEGLCYSWPAPRSVERPLADWWPADIRVGGLPVFPRLLVTSPRDDLVLRSFLGQPLILYAHHLDLARGLGVLGEAAAFVKQEEGVRWGPLSDVARSSFVTRHDGTSLRVRIYARKIALDVPEGVEEIIVELPSSHGEPASETVSLAADCVHDSAPVNGLVAGPFSVASPGRIEISLNRVDAVDVSRIPVPRSRLHPVLRRAATESRDRLPPALRKLLAVLPAPPPSMGPPI
jgi:hypothetical protein